MIDGRCAWFSNCPKHPDYRFFPPQGRRYSVQEEGTPSRLPTKHCFFVPRTWAHVGCSLRGHSNAGKWPWFSLIVVAYSPFCVFWLLLEFLRNSLEVGRQTLKSYNAVYEVVCFMQRSRQFFRFIKRLFRIRYSIDSAQSEELHILMASFSRKFPTVSRSWDFSSII